MCVSMYVCVCLCIYECVSMHGCVCMYVRVYLCVSEFMLYYRLTCYVVVERLDDAIGSSKKLVFAIFLNNFLY